MSIGSALLLAIVNGSFEELFLTGYLIKVLRESSAVAAIGASLLVRALYHLYQGPLGALSVVAFGLVVTAYYWRYRQLCPAVSAHILADFIAFQ